MDARTIARKNGVNHNILMYNRTNLDKCVALFILSTILSLIVHNNIYADEDNDHRLREFDKLMKDADIMQALYLMNNSIKFYCIRNGRVPTSAEGLKSLINVQANERTYVTELEILEIESDKYLYESNGKDYSLSLRTDNRFHEMDRDAFPSRYSGNCDNIIKSVSEQYKFPKSN